MLQNTFQLRYYQQDAVNQFTMGSCNNGIIVCPTGAGKSLIISALANAFQEYNVLILQPNKEILEQNFEKYQYYTNNGGIYSASLGKRELKQVTFATIGTISKLPTSVLRQFKILVIDECHLCGQFGQYASLIQTIEPYKLIGLTATPYRNDSKMGWVKYEMLTRKRDPIFHTIAYKYQIQDCIKDGFWCPLSYHTPVDYNTENLTKRGNDYKEEAIASYNFAIHLHEKIIGIVNASNKKHFLVFLTTIEECIHTENLLLNAGISCRAIHSKLNKKEREEILLRFKTGKIKVVLNVGVLTTGFDFPELDCLILSRPTMSLSLYYQMLGRAVRPHKNKDYADIYDLCGNVKYFGRIETLRFIGDDNRRLGLSSDAQILIKPPKSFMQKVFSEKIKHENAGSLVLQTGKFAGKTVEEIFSNYRWYVDFCIEKNTSYKPIFEKYIAEMQEQAKQISNF